MHCSSSTDRGILAKHRSKASSSDVRVKIESSGIVFGIELIVNICIGCPNVITFVLSWVTVLHNLLVVFEVFTTKILCGNFCK